MPSGGNNNTSRDAVQYFSLVSLSISIQIEDTHSTKNVQSFFIKARVFVITGLEQEN